MMNRSEASASYGTQASVNAANTTWVSQNHMTGGGATGHTDGLLYFNQKLYSPIDNEVPISGNFAAMSNVEAGQPNYSTIGLGDTRTFSTF